jgi:hypothetical protein
MRSRYLLEYILYSSVVTKYVMRFREIIIEKLIITGEAYSDHDDVLRPLKIYQNPGRSRGRRSVLANYLTMHLNSPMRRHERNTSIVPSEFRTIEYL